MMNSIMNYFKKSQTIIRINAGFFVKDYEKMDSLISEALERWPTDFSLLRLAQKYYQDIMNWDKFFGIYYFVDSIDVDKLTLKRNLGLAYLGRHQYGKAVEQFLICLNVLEQEKPNSVFIADISAMLSICYGYIGQWENTELYLMQAEAIVNWSPDVIYARLLFYLGTDLNKAKIFIDECIAKFPSLYTLYYWKDLYFESPSPNQEKELDLLLSAIARINYVSLRRKFDPYFISHIYFAHPQDVLKNCLSIYSKLRQKRKAYFLLFWAKVKLIDIDISIQKAYIELESKEYMKAERIATSLIKRRSTFAQKLGACIVLALAKLYKGDNLGSQEDAEKAIRIDPTSYEVLVLIGELHLNNKEWLLALDIYKKAVEINRFNFRHWEMLGFCYNNVGELELAKTSYDEAHRLVGRH